MSRRIITRVRLLGGRFRSFLPSFKNAKFKSARRTSQKNSHQQSKESDTPAAPLQLEVGVLRDNGQHSKKDHGNSTKGNRICIPSNIEASIVSVEQEGHKLPAIVLDRSTTMDWNAVLIYKSKIKGYTRELQNIDATVNRLKEVWARAVKEGDEYAETRKSTMQIADLIKTETIQRLRAEIGDLERKLTVLSEQKNKLVGKLTHAQNVSDLSQSNLERTIRCLFEKHNLLEDIPISEDGQIISQLPFQPELHNPSPIIAKVPSPTPTEVERRESQQKIWDLSEKVQSLETKLNDWPTYRSSKLESYLQALEAGKTSETQTTFDLKLLKESQVTTRELIEAEAEYAETEKRAREIGVFVDNGEKEEGFSECDDDGYTISHEEDLMYEGYLSWIYGWMEETPEKGADPDNIGVAQVELDDWDAKVVEMGDSVSVRDLLAMGRRRERIDGYRKACETLMYPRT